MAEFEQHLTNEQLSALLDGQLLESEQEYANKHLPTCEQCQQQQAELRQVVAFLHALPQPALPRSFALPLDFAVAEANITPIKTSRPLRTRPAQPLLPNYVRSTLRAISTIAAVIGIVFLLTSMLPLIFPGTMMRTANSSSGASMTSAPQAVSGINAPDDSNISHEAMSPRASGGTPTKGMALATPSAPSKYQQSQSKTLSVAPPPTPSQFDLNTSQGQTMLGFLLLALGIIGLTIFRRRKHSLKTNNVP